MLWQFLQINDSSYNFTKSAYDNSKTTVVPIILSDWKCWIRVLNCAQTCISHEEFRELVSYILLIQA